MSDPKAWHLQPKPARQRRRHLMFPRRYKRSAGRYLGLEFRARKVRPKEGGVQEMSPNVMEATIDIL